MAVGGGNVVPAGFGWSERAHGVARTRAMPAVEAAAVEELPRRRKWRRRGCGRSSLELEIRPIEGEREGVG